MAREKTLKIEYTEDDPLEYEYGIEWEYNQQTYELIYRELEEILNSLELILGETLSGLTNTQAKRIIYICRDIIKYDCELALLDKIAESGLFDKLNFRDNQKRRLRYSRILYLYRKQLDILIQLGEQFTGNGKAFKEQVTNVLGTEIDKRITSRFTADSLIILYT